MHRLTFTLLVSILSVASTSAQERVEPPVLSAKTDLVTLAVTVVDKRGAFVTGLDQKHFTVFDEGEPQSIEFFTTEDLSATIGLIVDSSGSMRGRRQEVASAAAAFVRMRHAADEFFTVNFNEFVWPGLPPGMLFTSDAYRLYAVLSAGPAHGLTALYDAVDYGLRYLNRGTRDRKALILVSDGGDNASRLTLDTVLEHGRETNAVIYSITFFDPDNHEARPQILKKLTRETGGAAFFVSSPEDVTRAFMRIAQEIHSGYTIGFEPAETQQGGYRSLRVVVRDDDQRQLFARTRAGYYASPPQEQKK
jgi:VWFA-related protein